MEVLSIGSWFASVDWGHLMIMILAIGAGLFAIVGSIIPALPGPPVGWLGMLLVFLWGGPGMSRGDISLTALIVLGVIMVIVSVLDYVLPVSLTKATGGSKYGSKGAMVGLVIGCFFSVGGFWAGIAAMLVLPFFGALLYEIIWGHKSGKAAAKGAFGSFLGLLSGTGLKLICSCVMLCYII